MPVAVNFTLEVLARAPHLTEALQRRVASGTADFSILPPELQAVLAPSDRVSEDEYMQAAAKNNHSYSKTAARSEIPVQQNEGKANAEHSASYSHVVKKPTLDEAEQSSAAAVFQEYLDAFPQHKADIQNAVEALVNMFSGISEAQARAWYRNISATYGGEPLTAVQVTTIVEQGAQDVEAVLQMVLDVKNDPTTSRAALEEADEFLLLHQRAMLDGDLEIHDELLRRQMLVIHTDVNLPGRTNPTPIGSVVMTESRALEMAGVADVSALTEARIQVAMKNAHRRSMTQEEVSALDRMFHGSQGLLARADKLRQAQAIREDSLALGID